MALSFLVATAALLVDPALSGLAWGLGVPWNVAVALGTGIYLGWERRWEHVVPSAASGAAVITGGLALLAYAEHQSPVSPVLVIVAGITLAAALLGMVVLVTVGAVGGHALRALLGTCQRCLAARHGITRRPTLGQPQGWVSRFQTVLRLAEGI